MEASSIRTLILFAGVSPSQANYLPKTYLIETSLWHCGIWNRNQVEGHKHSDIWDRGVPGRMLAALIVPLKR